MYKHEELLILYTIHVHYSSIPYFTEEKRVQGVALTGLKSIRGQIWTESSAMRAPLKWGQPPSAVQTT